MQQIQCLISLLKDDAHPMAIEIIIEKNEKYIYGTQLGIFIT
jgi:hypothetical protein